MVAMGGFTGAYVVRHGWTRAGASWFAVTALLIGVGFLPHMEPPDLDHIELVFSPFALWTAAVCSSRRKAVRVDGQGITLHRLLPFRASEFVPWADVVAVDWSGDDHFWGRTSSLTVHRRAVRPVPAPPRFPVWKSWTPTSPPRPTPATPPPSGASYGSGAAPP